MSERIVCSGPVCFGKSTEKSKHAENSPEGGNSEVLPESGNCLFSEFMIDLQLNPRSPFEETDVAKEINYTPKQIRFLTLLLYDAFGAHMLSFS